MHTSGRYSEVLTECLDYLRSLKVIRPHIEFVPQRFFGQSLECFTLICISNECIAKVKFVQIRCQLCRAHNVVERLAIRIALHSHSRHVRVIAIHPILCLLKWSLATLQYSLRQSKTTVGSFSRTMHSCRKNTNFSQMENILKLLSRFAPTNSTPQIHGNWVRLVFPKIPETRPKLGRWRNVKKGLLESDVHDPAYLPPMTQDNFHDAAG